MCSSGSFVVDARPCPVLDNDDASSGCGPPGFIANVISDAGTRSRMVRRREASQRSKERLASIVAATMTFLIFAWAIRSCIPPEITTMHTQSNQHLRSTASEVYADEFVPNSDHRRLTHMEDSRAPNDLRKMHKQMQWGNTETKRMEWTDPKTSQRRKAMPLDTREYKLNPLVKPEGYPWHRWTPPADGRYALDTAKFVRVLSRLGNGENALGTVTPNNYTVGGVKLTPDEIRLGNGTRPYIIRGGTVLRPGGRTGMFVTLVQRAVEMAKSLVKESPRLKLITEGELPLIFDSNDYPWCGDDLVPIFRLNAIKSTKCQHSWPAMSLTYFNDHTNLQLAESPYQWDDMMAEWDKTYPWKRKLDKVVWRGRITGYTYKNGERPRQELVRYARNHLDIMDVKPSTTKSRMAQDDFQKYKAILDIDGNAWSARLGKLLCYNSVVIKVEPEYVGYWEKDIEPWVHYIPVESDFSDLEKTVRYVVDPKNEEQIKRIIKNGQQFCRTKLTLEQYTVDMLWTLMAYAELLHGSPDLDKAWKADSSAYKMRALAMAPFRPRVSSAQ
ncbi:hypothetical protein ACHAXT_002290 [Thalassiosira profunda]